MNETLPPSEATENPLAGVKQVPGVLLVFTGAAPRAVVMPFVDGALEVGRGESGEGRIDDPRVSRRHARIAFDGRRFTVSDLGSQNGSFADGEPIAAHTTVEAQRVIRVGDSLLLPLRDLHPFQERGVRNLGGFVRGPAMQRLLDEAARASQVGGVLHIRGESGTGKEGVAEAFHRVGARATGPFVPVNCASIPQALAERLLFGAKRGAFSGADADVPGYLQEADGGTLFLDEVAELELAVQAKLLRTLESKEVMALGAARPRKVDFRLCSATNKDLRAMVAAGKLREDLFFRIARPEVMVPAMRNRPDEIAGLAFEALRRVAPSLTPHVSFVEQCLLRPWPGNVRELFAEVRSAAQTAEAAGSQRVAHNHLAAVAGRAFSAAAGEAPAPLAPASESPAKKRMPAVDDAQRQRIEEALRANGGNVAATARALGLHRTQLRRLLERHGIVLEGGADTTDPGMDPDSSDG